MFLVEEIEALGELKKIITHQVGGKELGGFGDNFGVSI